PRCAIMASDSPRRQQRGRDSLAVGNGTAAYSWIPERIEQAMPSPTKTLPPTEQLIADLLAAGGVLRVPAWPSKGERDCRALVGSAQRFGKVPSGKRLTLTQ